MQMNEKMYVVAMELLSRFFRAPGKYIGKFLTGFGIIYAFGAVGNDDLLLEMGTHGSLATLFLKLSLGIAVAVFGRIIARSSIAKNRRNSKIVPIRHGESRRKQMVCAGK